MSDAASPGELRRMRAERQNRRRSRRLDFQFGDGEDWAITVSDNGVGMPTEPPPPGLGTKIVGAIARQLGAHFHVTDAFPGRMTSVSPGEALIAVA